MLTDPLAVPENFPLLMKTKFPIDMNKIPRPGQLPTQASALYHRTIMKRCSQSILDVRKALERILEHNPEGSLWLQEGESAESVRPALKVKREKLLDLAETLDKRTDDSKRLFQKLKAHSRISVEVDHEWSKPGILVNPFVYRYIYWIEECSIQRQRQTEFKMNDHTDPWSFKKWQRFLYTNVRARFNRLFHNFQLRLLAASSRTENSEVDIGASHSYLKTLKPQEGNEAVIQQSSGSAKLKRTRPFLLSWKAVEERIFREAVEEGMKTGAHWSWHCMFMFFEILNCTRRDIWVGTAYMRMYTETLWRKPIRLFPQHQKWSSLTLHHLRRRSRAQYAVGS